MKKISSLVIVTLLFFAAACGGGSGGGGDEQINAPSLEAIRTALSLNNIYGIVPGLTLGAIELPACTDDAGSAVEGLTYSISDLPSWLSFDGTTRALSLAEGTVVPNDALTVSDVSYNCTSGDAAAQTLSKTATSASQAFPVNDLDGGGVADGYEYEFGEVPLVGNTGWFWLTPGTVEPYRSGTGAFMIPTGINVVSDGMDPTDAADDTSDFDGDTLANNTEITNMTNMFVATSDGTFGTAATYATGDGPGGIVTGDLDGDGDLDLVVANRAGGTATVSVLPGDGDGTFGTRTDYAVADRPVDVALGDFDGDGDLDMVVTEFNTAEASVFLNNGSGIFGTPTTLTKAKFNGNLAVADLDGDGNVDIAAANEGVAGPGYGTNISVFLGNGDGTFAAKVDYTTGTGPSDVTLADLDGDGDIDMAITNGQDANMSILLNNGDGTFAAKVDYNTDTNPNAIVAADFDGDGDIDLAVTNNSSDDITVHPNNGDGTFGNATTYAASDAPGGIIAADIDGDGDIDLAYSIDGGGIGNTVEVRLNDGSGVFGGATSYTVGTRPTYMTTGDFNNDGKLDIANAHFAPNDPAVILNQ